MELNNNDRTIVKLILKSISCNNFEDIIHLDDKNNEKYLNSQSVITKKKFVFKS